MSRKNFKKPETKLNAEKQESTTSQKKEDKNSGTSYWDKKFEKEKPELVFGKNQFIIIGAGLTLLILGFLLMSGGSMPDDKWDTGVIYSFTRITLAPFIVLLGLAAVGYAIFYKTKSENKTEEDL